MKNLTLLQVVGLEKAKQMLCDDIILRAISNRPQKMVLLEGASGGGKTTLVHAVVHHFQEKYPNRFSYIELGITDLTEHVSSTAKKIKHLFARIRESHKPTILFIDESDTIFASRMNAGHIKEERTSSLMMELNDPIENLYIVCATNRPGRIDRAVLERFAERVNCPYPSSTELKQIINLHLSILELKQREILYNAVLTTPQYNWSGRDFDTLEDKFLTRRDVIRIDKPDYQIDSVLVCEVFDSMVDSKCHLKFDYLDEEKPNKKRQKQYQ
ncbi:MAG: AAA family ATPase [Candidatus Methanoperedens sp.]|nr:AAA family ATPase [Candidatus Methanoperedens sp.]